VSGLAGCAVVITRAIGQHQPLAALLEARGAVPVLFPTVSIRPASDAAALDAALDRLPECDWLVFTSANAVAQVWPRLARPGPARVPASVRIAAVGPATAEALAARGAGAAVIPDRYLGAAVPAALGDLRGRRVLLPRADIGRKETAAALRAAGADLIDVIAYHTVPAAPDRDGLARLRSGVDAVTFTAPSTVRNFLALVGSEALDLLRQTTVACLGPTTAAAVTSLGLAPPLIAAEATLAGLVDALDAHYPAPAATGPC